MLLKNIEANKLRVAKYYNKKVKIKQFSEGDLVWKVKLPIGSKDSKFSKWSPNWEGPYRIKCCAPGNAYILETLGGEEEFRSKSRVDLGEFFSEYGCIDPVDLHCLSVSTVMVYTSVRMAASIRSTPTATLV